MNAILYVDRTGCQWAYVPHDFPPHQSVYGYFAEWQRDGVFAQLNGLLWELVRQQEGKNSEPSACVIDAQSVKTSTSVPARSQGIDVAKKIVGRKRSVITDTLGLLLAVLVTAAGVQDSTAGRVLLQQAAADHSSPARGLGSTAGTASTSPSTQRPSASTWKSSNAPLGAGDSPRFRDGGITAGAARVRAGRRECCAGLSKHPLVSQPEVAGTASTIPSSGGSAAAASAGVGWERRASGTARDREQRRVSSSRAGCRRCPSPTGRGRPR
ncbi:transposase [Streptomyces sp. NBC_00016]